MTAADFDSEHERDEHSEEVSRDEADQIIREAESALIAALQESDTPLEAAHDAAYDAAQENLVEDGDAGLSVHRVRVFSPRRAITFAGLTLAAIGIIAARRHRRR